MAVTWTTFTKTATAFQDLGGRYSAVPYLVDFSKCTGGVASTDIVQICTVAAGTLVTGIATIIDAPVGATCAATIGDTTNSSGWKNSVNLNSAANTTTFSVSGTDTYCTNSKYYATATPISFTMSNACTTGKVVVLVYMSKVENDI